MEELKIMQKCKDWELSYFWKIYDIYVDKIYNFVYTKTTNREVSEDIVSDVFMSALKNINSFKLEENSSVKSWLYRIANNKVIDFYRTNKESESYEDYMDTMFFEDINKKIDDKDKLNCIQDFLSTFNKKHREVFLYRIWEDLSYKEISEITWLSENNCKKIVSRSIKIISANFILLLFLIIVF